MQKTVTMENENTNVFITALRLGHLRLSLASLGFDVELQSTEIQSTISTVMVVTPMFKPVSQNYISKGVDIGQNWTVALIRTLRHGQKTKLKSHACRRLQLHRRRENNLALRQTP